MSHPRVKICGHTHEEDVDVSVAAGADAVGVITEVPVDTHREVSPGRAKALLDRVPPLVTGVLVTMPESVEDALDLVERTRPDVLQIHGPFAPGAVEEVRGHVPVVKSVDATEPESARRFDAVANALLVDSVDPSGAGGTGETHDWTATGSLVETLDSPAVLAGGLTPENVREAVETVSPFGVDVAGGVETESGEKDHDAVARFVANATRRRVSAE
ncbi:phosphoribosylanthranilate isomerase [Natronorarus salvus]|uniref:phosphoribosylanthranilate isomerase n=1 Tax=Natronorarus salvus TaxID=3117733 RepID=UPI002F26A34C